MADNRLARALLVGVAVISLAGLLLAACQRGEDAPTTAALPPATALRAALETGSTAEPFNDIDSAACLDQAPATGCPGFVLAALADARDQCAGVGGDLQPSGPPTAWSLDANRDGSPEFLYDLTQNFHCDGAPSVFSCGSLGCPTVLHGRQGDAWVVLGYINAGDAAAIEILDTAGTSGYASLRGGCDGRRPCPELTHYTWTGAAYERTLIEVGTTQVDVTPGGLQSLVVESAVLAAPGSDAQAIASYPAGTDVAVIGKARESTYYYVSPCNACERGFLPASAFTP